MENICWLKTMLKQLNCIRILRIVSVMNRGGIETQIMNIYRKIDRNRFQFDFLVTRNEIGEFDDEIDKLGGRIYRIPSIRSVGIIVFIKNINDFFNVHNEYNIVHCHMNTWSGLFLFLAKINGINIRIAQSHSSQKYFYPKNMLELLEHFFKKIMKYLIKFCASHFWAVGREAGEWLFGKNIALSKMNIVPNAKDLFSFQFDQKARDHIRKDLFIPHDSYLIGHVGNFSYVKNHAFIINVFLELLNIDQETYLCLVGNGLLKNDIEINIKKLKIEDHVRVLGTRNDVNKLMSAFDILILPSYFEGMPNVVIEAQASGLHCFISDKITSEIDLGINLVHFLSLNNDAVYWAKKIFEYKNITRINNIKILFDKGYDLQSLVNWMQNFYSNTDNNLY